MFMSRSRLHMYAASKAVVYIEHASAKECGVSGPWIGPIDTDNDIAVRKCAQVLSQVFGRTHCPDTLNKVSACNMISSDM